MRVQLLSILLLLFSFCAFAQKVTIKRVELAGEKIIVHYDLEDSNPNNEYQILLYSSQSNFNTALTKVKGDVGNEVKPGSDRKIEWSIREELGPYKGRLSLEVRGKQFVPVAKFTNIKATTKMKRGKNHTITWKPGNSNPVTVEFLNGGQQINAVANQPNNGSYTLFISKHQSKGKDYIIRITDSRNSQDVAISQPFAVTPKIPLLLKIVPVLAIGGVAVALAGSGGGGDNPPGNTNGEIPVPDLPGN
jgi:hypothetical protein